MIKYYKIHLLPSTEQKELMYKSFNAARFAYNWALREQQYYIHKNGYPKHKFQLRKDFDFLKNLEAPFVLELSSKVTSQAVLDLCDDIDKNLQNNKPLPCFKSVHLAKKSFFHRGDKLYFTTDHVKLEKIGWVKLGEANRIPHLSEYINPRITHNGKHFYLTIGCKLPNNNDIPVNYAPLGVDLGITTLMACSDGTTYERLDMTKEFKKLKRLQRKAQKKYNEMKANNITQKSKNLLKLEHEITKLFRRISNKRKNNIHQCTSAIIKKRPSHIILDDLRAKSLLEKRHLVSSVLDCSFTTIQNQIKYKAELNNIPIIIADKYYPSSQICSTCQKRRPPLPPTERIFDCPYCKLSMNRDLNAALNLKTLAPKPISNARIF